ncbi:MAG TPA: ATP-binding protein, partial [Myxococcota bacterium]|nr:ATP-binding protein [Myxococcota bacterium]
LVGGATLRPGEVSLAHHGVLFLDEFPEFPRNIREALRAPMEDRQLVISRAEGQVCFPARFMLVAASNPCPCGYLGHPSRPCVCSPTLRERYRGRLSGPLIDRIDLRVQLRPTSPHDLLQEVHGESSQAVRQRVVDARERQRTRYGGLISSNAELPAEQVLSACDSHPLALRLLQKHLEDGAYSARVGRRLLKVARTLADLEGAGRVGLGHVRLAIDLRSDVEEQPCAS